MRRLTTILMSDMAAYSRLMEADEAGVVRRQKAYRASVIDPAVTGARGRIIKTTGDGLLAEFPSARAALRCALDVQLAMHEKEAGTPEDRRIRYRIGLNTGDVLDEDGDLYGDAVNVAARLQQLAEPGGVCIPDALHQMVRGQLTEGFTDLGSQTVRNISRPVRVWQWTPSARPVFTGAEKVGRRQTVGFCTAPDGVKLAYATVGSGPVIYKMPNWLNHLEYDWSSPIWGPFLQAIARGHRLVRFDQRGNGLSDWEPGEISLAAMQSDVEAVADAARLERCAVLGVSQGCAIAIRYAIANPERVSCLILAGGYARGALKRDDPEQEALHEATVRIIRSGWGSSDPAFRHMFTEILMPDASPAQKASFDELQRVASSPENAAQINDMNANVEVSALARQLCLPVLVLHCEGDRRIPIEEGRRLAALVPGAEFQTLPGNNHLLIPGSPACEQFLQALHGFVARHGN